MTQTNGIPFRTKPDANVEQSTYPHVESDENNQVSTATEQPTSDFLTATDWGAVHNAQVQAQENPASELDETNVQPQEAIFETTTTEDPETKPVFQPLDDVELRVSNEFTPIKEENWDTVLYIGPPSRQHGQSEAEYNYIEQHFSRPYLMRSQTLRESGSAEFVRRLGPMSARVARKLRNLGLHHNLPNDGTPTYWIDLRPMQNDEEAMLTVAELTCTPGVLAWHQHEAALHVDPSVIKGKDTLNTPSAIRDSINLPTDFFSKGAAAFKSTSRTGASQPLTQSDDGLEDDYSPLRHHTAIERLLYAIAGRSPKLNSAPKMWNFFAIARIFDCAQHPRVSSEIYTWIFSGANCNFIPANPEVCYRIAMGTQSDQGTILLRIVFSILVGEKALEQAMSRSTSQQAFSVQKGRNRPLSHLDDDEINRIDHAAQSLTVRIQRKFRELNDSPFIWMARSTELFKLLSLVSVHEKNTHVVENTINKLLQHMRNEIMWALTQDLSVTTHMLPLEDKQKLDARRTLIKESIENYNSLTLPQRLLNQKSWKVVEDYSILRDTSRFMVLGSYQRDGLDEVKGQKFSNMPTTGSLGLQLEGMLNTINNHIADGALHFNGIFSHKDHIGDYEVRWDALYAAACRNLGTLSNHATNAEIEALLNVARRREQLHSQGVTAYEAANQATPRNAHRVESDWRSKGAAFTGSTDHYYTSAKIDRHALLNELSSGLKSIIDSDVLRQGYLKHTGGLEADVNVGSIDTLLCLDDDEFRYLPLWADGCDDGTGGVFTETVPGAIDEDFQGGKRGLGGDDEGLDHLEDVEMGESFSVIDTLEAESTVAGASKVATAGCGTDSVMSMDE